MLLIGNSADPTNNHIDIFNFLKKINLIDTTLIVSLSYGNENYKNFIIQKGNEFFGDIFKPLTHYLSAQSYAKYLSIIDTAFFYHFRGQAMGNIMSLLYLGCNINLSEKSSLYKLLKRKNLRVKSIEEIFSNKEFDLNKNPMNKSNSILVRKLFSDDELIKIYRKNFG